MIGRHTPFVFASVFLVLAGHPAFAHDSHRSQVHGHGQLAATDCAITVDGDIRIIRGTGLPQHATGTFPNRGNPHAIRRQHYEFHVPAHPARTGRTLPLDRHPFGIAVNGVTFDPGTAGFWNRDPHSGWRREALGERRRLGLMITTPMFNPTAPITITVCRPDCWRGSVGRTNRF